MAFKAGLTMRSFRIFLQWRSSFFFKTVSTFLILLAASSSRADGIYPMASDDPPVRKILNQTTFDFVNTLLGSARMAPHLKCQLKVHTSRNVRKFSDGNQWVEQMDIEFRTNSYDSGRKVSFVIPVGVKYGVKKEVNQWSGAGETFKIEVGDAYDHWLRFTHDGRGSIVGIQAGNIWQTYSCELNR